jgi:prevent-host-death family protein
MVEMISASDFKATCLALLDEVAQTHSSYVVTKYGRPVARLVPIEGTITTMGSVTPVAEADEDYFSIAGKWDAEN